MKDDISRKFVKLTTWIIFLSIIGLIMISLFPWITVKETKPVEDHLYFNFEMMKKSIDDNIITLAENINLINNLFFLILIFAILSYIGLTINKSRINNLIAQIIMLIAAAVITITNILIFYLQYNFVKIAEDIEGVSTAHMIPFIKFIYFPMIISILILIYSVSYLWRISSHLYYNYKEKTEIKNKLTPRPQPPKIPEKKIEKQNEPIIKQKAILQTNTDEKTTLNHGEIEDWLKDELKSMGSGVEEKKEEKIEETEEKTSDEKPENTETDKTEIKKEENLEETKKPDEKEPEIKKEAKTEQSYTEYYEKALSSAINKKQKEIKNKNAENKKNEKKTSEKKETRKEKTDEQSEKIKFETEKQSINVYCPNCGNVFMVEKTGFTKNTKCPKCGRDTSL